MAHPSTSSIFTSPYDARGSAELPNGGPSKDEVSTSQDAQPDPNSCSTEVAGSGGGIAEVERPTGVGPVLTGGARVDVVVGHAQSAIPSEGTEREREGESPDNPGRRETESERDDRNLMELLQELRVGALGVQVLFGFLLSLPFFAARFGRLSHFQRGLYVADLLMAALATALFTAPVAYHRLVFRRHRKARLLRMANSMAIAGLGSVGLAISGSVLLAVSDVDRGVVVPALSALVLATFVILWFVLPLAGRHQPNR
jgi:hypothetical protein